DFAAEVTSARARVTVRGRDAAEWDLFLTPRALGDAGDADVQLELYRVLARAGALLVNDVDALLVAIDKFRTSWELARAGVPTPDARVAQTREQARAALAALGDVVVKPVYGSLGLGVERVADGARLDELVDARGAVYLQRFVDGATSDVRAFVIGDRVAAAMARRPRPGDFRSNAYQGSTARAVALDDRACAVAVAATRAVGLDYSGVDLLVGERGAEVIEVNGTPSFRAIWDATGRDMAPLIVAHATALIFRRRQQQWRVDRHRQTNGGATKREGDQDARGEEDWWRHDRARGGP
ncbi:MAG TPA: RimK family alpha-L-glutamate ligase, partial [Polyangia bacterium]|nr:RimK family alpha-L-glutamate ligase [Polyangia bacterium]